jgi:hypothetical protein
MSDRKEGTGTAYLKSCNAESKIISPVPLSPPGIETFHLLFNLLSIKKSKAVMVCIETLRLQTMTALMKSFCGGFRGTGVRRTHPIRGGIVSEDFFHFFTCTCNLHLSPLA